MTVQRRRLPIATRFWARVDTSAGPEACWPWLGARDPNGYGRIGKPGREGTMLAARLSLQLAGVDIDGCNVLHACDHPSCVNPAHLRCGTQQDNMRDAFERGRGWTTEMKLTAEDAARIRASRLSQTTLAGIFGVDQSHISMIKSGRRWRVGPRRS
jgi:hypothetical protein